MADVKKAIILARVSTAGQAEEEVSIPRQLERGRVKAAELGAEVVKEYVEEGVSGRKERRDVFQEAVDYCTLMKVDYFVLWSTSRFSRNRAVAAWTKYNLRRAGTELVYVSQDIDVKTDAGWLLEGVFELFDEQLSRTISKDTLGSMMRNAGAGYFNGGNAPFGYAVVPDGKRKRLAVLEEEAAIVRRMFAMCLEGSGCTAIALWLNGHGFMHRGAKWTKDAVMYVLKNWASVGYVTFNKTNHATRSKRPPSEWIRTKSHAAIIDEQQFKLAQDLIGARMPERELGSPKSTFIFTGLLKCGDCGAAMQIRTGTSSSKDKAGEPKVYSYYQCGSSLRGKGCSSRMIRAELFDRVIATQLLEEVLNSDSFVDMAADLEALAGTWAKDRAAQREILVGRLRDAEKRRKNLFDLLEQHGTETPNLGDLTVRLRALNEEIKTNERSLAELEDTRPPAAPSLESVDAVADLVVEVFNRAEPGEIRGFLGSFIDKIVLKAGETEYHYHPDRLFDAGFVRSRPGEHPGHAMLRTAVKVVLPLPLRLRAA